MKEDWEPIYDYAVWQKIVGIIGIVMVFCCIGLIDVSVMWFLIFAGVGMSILFVVFGLGPRGKRIL